MQFKPDEAMYRVFSGEATRQIGTMLTDTLDQVRRYPDIQRSMRLARKHVDTRTPFHDDVMVPFDGLNMVSLPAFCQQRGRLRVSSLCPPKDGCRIKSGMTMNRWLSVRHSPTAVIPARTPLAPSSRTKRSEDAGSNFRVTPSDETLRMWTPARDKSVPPRMMDAGSSPA